MVSHDLYNDENFFDVLLKNDFATFFVYGIYGDIPDFCGCGKFDASYCNYWPWIFLIMLKYTHGSDAEGFLNKKISEIESQDNKSNT